MSVPLTSLKCLLAHSASRPTCSHSQLGPRPFGTTFLCAMRSDGAGETTHTVLRAQALGWMAGLPGGFNTSCAISGKLLHLSVCPYLPLKLGSCRTFRIRSLDTRICIAWVFQAGHHHGPQGPPCRRPFEASADCLVDLSTEGWRRGTHTQPPASAGQPVPTALTTENVPGYKLTGGSSHRLPSSPGTEASVEPGVCSDMLARHCQVTPGGCPSQLEGKGDEETRREVWVRGNECRASRLEHRTAPRSARACSRAPSPADRHDNFAESHASALLPLCNMHTCVSE